MSLSTVLEQINKYKIHAEMDINSGPRETFAGREGLQRKAREELKELKEKYITELRNTSIFILVSGSGKDQFSELATTEFKCFSADPKGFYKSLADRLPLELYMNKPAAANLFDIMGRHLEDIANDMKIVGYPQLIMKGKYQRAISSKEDFLGLIQEAINEQVGSEITSIYVARSIADKAIAMNHASKVTPIVLTSDDESLLLDIHNTSNLVGVRSFLVAAGKGTKKFKTTEGAFVLKEVTKETVENNLTNISSLCKNK